MSQDDAATNSARAQELQTFIDGARLGRTGDDDGALSIYVGDHQGQEIRATVKIDTLLAAVNALESQGVKGWAAARLQCKEVWGPAGEDYADVALEAADTAEDTLTRLRASIGDAEVDEAIDELAEQL